jgi:hypothetical protein
MRLSGAGRTSLLAGIAGAGAGLLLGGSPVSWGLGAAALTYGGSVLLGRSARGPWERTGLLAPQLRGMRGGWYYSSPEIEATDARDAIASMYPQWPAYADASVQAQVPQPMPGTYPGYGFGGWGWGHGL